MGKKEKIKIVLSALGMVIVLFSIVGMAMYLTIDNDEKEKEAITPPGKISGNFIDSDFGRYIRYDDADDSVKASSEKYNRKTLTTYEDYRVFINDTDYESKLTESDFKEKAYIILFTENEFCEGTITKIKEISYKDVGSVKNIMINLGYNRSCTICPKKYNLFLIPIDKYKIAKSTVIIDSYAQDNVTPCNTTKDK